MSQRVVVTRIYGDQNMGAAIANTFESAELKYLRAKVGTSAPREEFNYMKKIRAARRKYATKPMPEWKQRVWGLIGLATLLFVHPEENVWKS